MTLTTYRPLINTLIFALSTAASAAMYGSAHAASNVPMLRLDPSSSVAEYLSCLAAENITLVSAHRGGPKPGYPENALESLQEAVSHGPMLLEIDVRETADGQLVLLHDDTLSRTTTGSGKLIDFSLAQLKSLRLKDNDGQETGFAIPTLNDVLKWTKNRAIVQLDVKRGVDYSKVAQAVVDANAVDSVLIVVYRLNDAVTSLKVNPNLSFSYSINNKGDLVELRRNGIAQSQIVAWTGVVDKTDKPVWPVLESLKIPSAAGAFWHLEKRIIQSGDTSPYIDLTEHGLDVIASDYYWIAYDTLARNQNLTAGVAACVGQ